MLFAMSEASGKTTTNPPYATTALELMLEEWTALGTTDEKNGTNLTQDVIIERLTALLMVRCVACIAPLGTYPDLSVSTMCRTALTRGKAHWPGTLSIITTEFMEQLKEFVMRIVKGYKDEVPYHNAQHCYHVVLSTCKLIDMIVSRAGDKSKTLPPSFGLRNDPFKLLALAFAALIHDVEHQGIPNRQLAQEKDRLAVLYNDQSIAENWSLYIAFSDFLQDEFAVLRQVLFTKRSGEDNAAVDKSENIEIGEKYLSFRKAVINLVLNTDIASPERTQISKSKWKEAFGDPFETVERKVRAELRRASLTGKDVQISNFGTGRGGGRAQRRLTGESAYSEISFDGAKMNHRSVEEEDEDSLSATPENSAHGDDIGGGDHSSPIKSPTPGNALAAYPLTPASGTAYTNRNIAERRMSAASRMSTNTQKYRMRLGILRTVDLSGETIENYSRAGSIGHSTVVSSEHGYSIDLEGDEPDELRATVLMETIVTAADVAHNLQGWDQMVKWSNRLYLELRKAYQAGRGVDAQPRWFENQIGFLESYLLPLAHRLEDTGVFGNFEFGNIVESNQDKWLTDGYDVTQKIVGDGAAAYPVK